MANESINIENFEKELPLTEEVIHVDVMNHTTHRYTLDGATFTTSDHPGITEDEWNRLRTNGVVTHSVRNGNTIDRITYYNIDIMNDEVYYSLLNICSVPTSEYETVTITLHRNSDNTIFITIHNMMDNTIKDEYVVYPSMSVIVSLISDDVFRPKHDRIVEFLKTLLNNNIEETLKWS